MAKRFRLVLITLIFLSYQEHLHGQIRLSQSESGVLIMENDDSILFYQRTPKSLNGEYARTNYIHPLYSLDGTVLTEDFPADHPHQRGVFWAWHQIFVGDLRVGDGWDIKDISWDVDDLDIVSHPDSSKTLQAKVNWYSPNWTDNTNQPKPFIQETTSIHVYTKKDDFRIIDFTIKLLALIENVRIGGSENEKGYGGFSVRMRLPDDTRFTAETGEIIPQNLPLHAGSWVDISGNLEQDGSKSGISILSHPDNPGYPHPWILRSEKSMQNVVFPHPGKNTVQVSQSTPISLKYRLIIHKGAVNHKLMKTISKVYR